MSAEEVVSVQKQAENLGLIFGSFALFLHGLGIGAGFVYAGVVLPHHTG